jgi:glucokinase
VPTELRSQASLLDSIERLVERVAGDTTLVAIGFGLPSQIDERHGRVLDSTNVPLEDIDFKAEMGRRLGVPVTIDNDANAACLAEARIGAARDAQHMVMLTLGTGVGGAILSEGRILRGHAGRAGHLGHLCLDPFGAPDIVGTPGSLEDWIGNHNIAQRTAGRFATTHALIAAFAAGDPTAREFWLRAVRGLACALVSLINILDPEAVILGGGIAQAGEALFSPLQHELETLEWRPTGTRVRLLPAQLGEWAGALGAAHAAATQKVSS